MPADARWEPVMAALPSNGYQLSRPGRAAMMTSHIRAPSRRVGALLGAIAILLTGCVAPGAGSGPRSGRAGVAPDTVAASPSGHSSSHRTTGTTGTRSVRHGRAPT